MDGNKGLTLIELLCTLAVASILLTIGMPSFSDLINKVQSKTYGQSLHQMLQFGRQSAVLNNATVTICQTSKDDRDACNFTKTWDDETIVFIDVDSDDRLQTAIEGGEDILLRRFPPPPDNGTLRATRPYFSFSPPGTSNQSASLIFCPYSSLAPATRVIVMYSGRVRFAQQNEIECIG